MNDFIVPVINHYGRVQNACFVCSEADFDCCKYILTRIKAHYYGGINDIYQ